MAAAAGSGDAKPKDSLAEVDKKGAFVRTEMQFRN